jgi:arginyl-tRNA synthetase
MQIAIAVAINSEFKLLLDPREIALEICYPRYDAHYTSAIALAIANRLQRNPAQIADAIAQACSQNLEISSQWKMQALGKGWLNISLSEKYLSESLFSLDDWQIEGITNCYGFWQKCEITLIPVDNSTEQYAYARCCALMRLAKVLNNAWVIHELPLHYLEPIEISLLMQNFAIAAYLESEHLLNSHKSRIRLSRSLAEAFLQFYDRCRIFGVPREIAIRRLFLIRVTQKMLIAIASPDINYAMCL